MKSKSLNRIAWQKLKKNKLSFFALYYIILVVLCIYGFAIANLVPIIIRQAVKQSNESIPMTVTNLITIGLSSTMILPAGIGFLAETYSLTLNMYLLTFVVFICAVIFLFKYK